MKVAVQPLEKMQTAGRPRAAAQEPFATGKERVQKPWQFSILAILTLTTASSLALVAVKPYWHVILEALRPTPAEQLAESILELEPLDPWVSIDPGEDPCPGCGQG